MTDASPVPLYGAAMTDAGGNMDDGGGAVALYGAAQTDSGSDAGSGDGGAA